MMHTLAVENYRTLLNLVVPLGPLNIITGPNGSGKSNLYKALRLLAETAQGGVVNSLAQEGGLQSTFWAGPETLSRRMRKGEVPVQGGPRKSVKRLKLGFCGDQFSYSISLGLPIPELSAFSLDPVIKYESIWAGSSAFRPAAQLLERKGALVRVRSEKKWLNHSQNLSHFESIFTQVADPNATPEVFIVRDLIRSWRFYDHFRSDKDAPARSPQLATRTPVLHHDGRDLAAALQTIIEMGDERALDKAVSDAFGGARLEILSHTDGRMSVKFHQQGLLRPLDASELSDGTLRFLLWVAALLTPRPPSMMVLNEPETSLHPDLIPALANLIIKASEGTQVWVVSHSKALIDMLSGPKSENCIRLEKELGQTIVSGQDITDRPAWSWPD